jgi:hypothetical protein
LYDASLGLLSGSRYVALATFLQLLRPETVADQRALRAYRGEVQGVASRLRQLFDEWVATREIEPDHSRLANVAAVNRWELMLLAERTVHLDVPRSLISNQRAVREAVIASARAYQLLANGYRFHKSEAVCDGQALLVETVDDLTALAAQLLPR